MTGTTPAIAALEERVRVLSTLLGAGRDICSTLDLEEVLNRTFESIEKVLRAERSSVWRYDAESRTLSFRMMRGGVPDESIRALRMKLGEGVVGWVAQTRQPVVISDVSKDPRWSRRVDEKTEFRTRSLLCIPLLAYDRLVGVIQLLNRVEGDPFTDDDLRNLQDLAPQIAVAMENALLYEEKRRTFLGLAATLAEVIEWRDAYTAGHIQRVVSYSLSIARRLQLPPAEIEVLKLSAILHDIGKIGIEDRILNKPARLDREEESRMREHVMIGVRILGGSPLLLPVIPGVRHHHEWWDGNGYPDGARGPEIALAGRIITVADTFDAMTSTRPYRRELPRETAIEELQRYAGRQFDPGCVEAFAAAYAAREVEFRPDDSILL